MGMYKLADRIWFGEQESATKVNLEGHGVRTVFILDAGQHSVVAENVIRISMRDLDDLGEEFVKTFLDTLLMVVGNGTRAMLIDPSGRQADRILACAFLSLMGHAWDEAWAAVLRTDPNAAPDQALFSAVRLACRELHGTIK